MCISSKSSLFTDFAVQTQFVRNILLCSNIGTKRNVTSIGVRLVVRQNTKPTCFHLLIFALIWMRWDARRHLYLHVVTGGGVPYYVTALLCFSHFMLCLREFQWKDFHGQQLLSNYGMQWGISHISQMSSLCHELCPVTVHSYVRALRCCQYKQEKPSSLTSVHEPSLQGSHVVPQGGCCLALATMTSSLRSPSHQSFGRKGIHNPVRQRHVKATCETPK